MRTSRLEAFSDGVIAIAITLLVLDLKVPELGGDLMAELRHQWPAYLGYVVSFVTIGIMWVNHHALFDRVARVDHALLYLNLFLLLAIATLPFTTSLAARYLREGADGRAAAAIYTLSMTAAGLMYLAIWRHLLRHPELLREGNGVEVARRGIKRTIVGPLAYGCATLVALVSAPAALVVCAGVAAWFLLPLRVIGPEPEPGDGVSAS